jgi:hypothetical protein
MDVTQQFVVVPSSFISWISGLPLSKVSIVYTGTTVPCVPRKCFPYSLKTELPNE